MNVISEIRTKYNLSQQKLAEVIGSSQYQISRWERSNNIPFKKVVEMSEMLNFKINLEVTTK